MEGGEVSKLEQCKENILNQSRGSIKIGEGRGEEEVREALRSSGFDVQKATALWFNNRRKKMEPQKSKSKKKSRLSCCSRPSVGDPGTKVVQEFSGFGGGNKKRTKIKTKKIKYKEKIQKSKKFKKSKKSKQIKKRIKRNNRSRR